MLTKIFGTFILRTNENVKLKIFINSQMDLSYYEKSNPSNSLIKEYLDKLKAGDNFIDVGANIGYYSLLASGKVGISGAVYSFEPSTREYKRLIDNIKLNNCSNVTPYNIALSDHSGETELHVSEGHTGLNKMRSR